MRNVTAAEKKTNGTSIDVPYYVRGLALGVPAYLIGVHLWTWALLLPVFLGGRADFRQLYTGGYMLRSGHAQELYDYMTGKHFQDLLVSRAEVALPINHLAYEELLFVPLSLVKYRTAYFLFLTVNVVLLAISFRLLQPWMDNLRLIWPLLPLAMYLGFLPAAAALMQGQDSILMLTLLSAALVALDRGREATAGVFVGCGLFKFQIVLPVALLFLVWRRWRFCGGFAVATAGLTSLSMWLVGFAQMGVYARSIASMSIGLQSEIAQFIYGIYPEAMINLRGLIFGLAGNHLSNLWLQVITMSTSAIVLLYAATVYPNGEKLMDAFILAIATSALVSYHLFIHDLSVLLIPIIVTLNRFIAAEATGVRSDRVMARAAALMFVAPLCISYIPSHLYLAALPLCAFVFVLINNFRTRSQSTSSEVEIASLFPTR